MLLKEIKENYPSTYKILVDMVHPDITYYSWVSQVFCGKPKSKVLTTSEEKLQYMVLRQPIFTICERMITMPEKFSMEETSQGVVTFTDMDTESEFPFEKYCYWYCPTPIMEGVFNDDELRLLEKVVGVLYDVLDDLRYQLEVASHADMAEKARNKLINSYKDL